MELKMKWYVISLNNLLASIEVIDNTYIEMKFLMNL